jgi:antirestriction protein ArdC
MSKSTTEKKTVSQIVAEQVIASLERNVIPWRQPWEEIDVPTSWGSKTPYRGINAFVLAIQQLLTGYSSNYWLTYKQIADAGGRLKETERTGKSTRVAYWNVVVREQKGADGKVKVNSKGKPQRYSQYYLGYHNVWNLDQTEGIEAPVSAGKRTHSPLTELTAILDAVSNHPRLAVGSKAFYSPALDVVTLPSVEAFFTPEDHLLTRVHEEAHATGHVSRLNRDLTGIFGSDSYAKEELVAEFTAALFGLEHGLVRADITEQRVAYCQSWAKRFRANPELVIYAAATAQKVNDYLHQRSYSEVQPVSEESAA